MVAYASR
jgi:hypothetical protein